MNQPAVLKSSFFVKLTACLLVAFAAWNIYHSLIMLLISYMFKDTQVPLIMGLAGVALFFAGVLFAMLYPIIWHSREKKGTINSNHQHALFQTIIRYWLALMIATYAFAKILGTQFSSDLVTDNSLAKNLSGFDLTWFYFSYSYAFSFTIALVQLAGAILLLFRKTVLAGVLILLPVMLNIVLINIFYTITSEAELNAIGYVVALLFLLSKFCKEIMDAFLNASKTISTITLSNLPKQAIRIAVIALPFFYIYYLSIAKEPESLLGKWKVETLVKGSDTLSSNAWLADATAWKYIYLQKRGAVVLNPNPYLVEIGRAQKGMFTYNASTATLQISLGKDKKTVDQYDFKIVKTDSNHMEWKGNHLGKNLEISLTRDN